VQFSCLVTRSDTKTTASNFCKSNAQ